MALASSKRITLQRIASPDALDVLLKSFDGLPNLPASLYLSNTSHNLVIYVAPTGVVNTITLPYLTSALSQQERTASALKNFFETGATTMVFFDARKTAKILFDSCGIKLSTPPCTERARIHEVQMMELAVRQGDNNRMWLAGLDNCIARDSGLNVDVLIPDGLSGRNLFDERILHLPVLWKKYHDQLHTRQGGGFWIANIRQATRLRLEVSCGETHVGYEVDSARTAWDREILEELMESWNEDVDDYICHGEEVLGADHWAKFDLL